MVPAKLLRRGARRSQVAFGIMTFFLTFVDYGYGPLRPLHSVWASWLGTLVLQEVFELYEDGWDW